MLEKQCYWCKLAEIPDEENQHPPNEVGAYDYETGKWICDDCKDAGIGGWYTDKCKEAQIRIRELEAKLEFADAGTEKLEGLIHTLRERIEAAREYINTLEALFADFGGGTDTHMMVVLNEWEEVNKKVGEASAKYYAPPPAEDTDA